MALCYPILHTKGRGNIEGWEWQDLKQELLMALLVDSIIAWERADCTGNFAALASTIVRRRWNYLLTQARTVKRSTIRRRTVHLDGSHVNDDAHADPNLHYILSPLWEAIQHDDIDQWAGQVFDVSQPDPAADPHNGGVSARDTILSALPLLLMGASRQDIAERLGLTLRHIDYAIVTLRQRLRRRFKGDEKKSEIAMTNCPGHWQSW